MFDYKKRAIAAALLAAFVGPALAAKDVVIGVPDNLTGLDPQDINDTLSMSATRAMLQGLFGFDKDMKLVPLLAESYQANADATVFTIRLRQGVKFHDGSDFDAAAVKVNFDRLANPDNRLKRHSLLAMVKQTEVVDPYTVRLHLDKPFGALINNLAHPGAMLHSPKALEQHGKEVARHPVGTGPFKFVNWSADTLKLAKNESYWRQGLPKVDSLTIRSVPENGSRVAMLAAGEAQFIYPVPPEMVKVVQANAKLQLQNEPSIVVRYAAMNNLKKPFDDVRVRQALNYAVDKKAFVKVVYSGYADPLDAPLPPSLGFYAKQGEWPYDPAKARALLTEAGYPNGFETEVFGKNNTTATRAMQFLQQQLAQVGVKLKVSPLEAGVEADKVWGVQKPEDSTVQIQYGGWSASTGDADWGLRPLLYGEGFPPKLFNVAYYQNPSVDEAIRAGISTADPARRAEAYKAAQAQIWQDAPWIFLAVDRLLSARSKNLNGLYQLPDGSLAMEEVELH